MMVEAAQSPTWSIFSCGGVPDIVASGINDEKSDEEISRDLLAYRDELQKAGDELSSAHNALNPAHGTSPVDMTFTEWVEKNTGRLNDQDRKLLENDKNMMTFA